MQESINVPSTTVMGSLTTCLISGFQAITNLFKAIGNTSSAGERVTKAWDHTAHSYEEKALNNRNLDRLANEEEYAANAARLTAKLKKTK